MTMRRSYLTVTLVGLVVAVAATATVTRDWGRPMIAQQPPPALASEDLLRLVLPLDAAGRRPGVIAWARLDDASARDGSPLIFVTLLYETPAPFGGTDLRRLVNRVGWNGRQYVALREDEPGEVWEGDLAALALRGWSVEIEVASNQSEGNPIYTVVYKGNGSQSGAGAHLLSVTELFRPSTDLLWRRVTDARLLAADGVTHSERVRWRFEPPRDGAAMPRLIADIEETTEVPQPGSSTPLLGLRLFIETYLFEAEGYRLDTRVIAMFPQR